MLVGAGGVLAELYRDYSMRMAPVSEEEARGDDRGGERPCRDPRLPQPAAGRSRSLAKVISRVSALALVPEVSEAEVNPLLVRSDGVVAVDALVAFKE